MNYKKIEISEETPLYSDDLLRTIEQLPTKDRAYNYLDIIVRIGMFTDDRKIRYALTTLGLILGIVLDHIFKKEEDDGK